MKTAIHRRTFEAATHIPGTEQRAALNCDPLTSEYFTSHKFLTRRPALMSDGTPNLAQKFHNTTHCRGGWVVTLAGEKGRALEAASSTLFAAMQIYKASSPIRVSPVRFFETNEVALADIRKCAELEATTPKPAGA